MSDFDFRARNHVLSSLDCSDEALAPIDHVIGDARVVALGEGVHFVSEFGQARRRLLRYLHERHGFRVLAFEFGFAEAEPLDAWIRGGGADDDLATMAGTTNSGMNGAMARFLRSYNATTADPVRLLGVDTPMAGGTLAHVLEPLVAYVEVVDPDQAPLARRALELNGKIEADSVAAAAVRWAELSGPEQAELTAALSRLGVRMRALEPLYVERGGRDGYDRANRNVDIAAHGDYMFGVIHPLLFGGESLPLDSSVRDRLMADTLRWHLDRLEPDERVVLMAHNNHVQKTRVEFDGPLAYSMGSYLATELGDDYRSIAMTYTASSVPEMVPDEAEAVGFRVVDTEVGAPPDGSVEQAIAEVHRNDSVTVTDLRGAGGLGPTSMRAQSDDMPIAVAEAFDAVVSVPTATPEVELKLG